MTNEYHQMLIDRFDELDARRQRHGGILGPDAEVEYRRLGEAIEAARRSRLRQMLTHVRGTVAV